MTDKQFDKWFAENIVAPARANWGAGWNRLSEESKIVEVQARIAGNLMGNHRIDEVEHWNDTDAAAIGRHVRKMTLAFRRWIVSRP